MYAFIEGNLTHTSGRQGVVDRIVLHGTVSELRRGSARDVAAYFTRDDAGGLAHYVGDSQEVVQCCREDIVAWHAPPNFPSLGFEFCDPQAGPDFRWEDGDHSAMLAVLAKPVAEAAQRWHVPIAYLGVGDLLAGHRGITTHYNVSQAFHQSDHTDPGPGFPIAQFLAEVSREAAALYRPVGVPGWWPHDLGPGSTGGPVKRAQQIMGFPEADCDGLYGAGTMLGVRHFQHGRRLREDGIIGAMTAKAMGS